MDYAIRWGGDPEDLCLTATGVGRFADLDAMMEEARADPRWVEGMRVLVDFSGVDWSGVSVDQMQARVEVRSGSAPAFWQDRYQQFSVVVRPTDYAFGRLMGLAINRKVAWVSRVFDCLSDAREWLRRPDLDQAHVMPGRSERRAGAR